jgi:hypothetical protein
VFKNWVDQYFIEGADYDILDRIRTFAAEVMANDTIKMPSEQLIRAVNRRVRSYSNELFPTSNGLPK